jgi:2-polyprenyl-3-methyl-5-hydroxy-6-metoxy-1,4-benzoquinol methylase
MLKTIIKKFIPNIILKYREKYIIKKNRSYFSKMKDYEIFKEIYLKKLWDPALEKSNHKFYSGPGSHFPELVDNYINEVKKFLTSLPKKPNVVDLGCGDFSIGSKIRKLCDNYIAVDIFDKLIYFNKKKYADLNVDFRILDITCDELPSGDICFVRQVLQHLSNKSIIKFIKAIKNKYKYLIITEHFPPIKNFVANVDKPTGPDIRIYDKSAVILTAPPFNLKAVKDIDICETAMDSIEGVLNTKLLQLKD